MSLEITDVQVWPLKGDHPKIKANGSFTVNNALKVKCTVFKGPKGLFVGLPGKFGDKPGEDGNKPWYADVTLVDDEVRNQVNKKVLEAYNKATGKSETLNQGEASGPSSQTDNIPF